MCQSEIVCVISIDPASVLVNQRGLNPGGRSIVFQNKDACEKLLHSAVIQTSYDKTIYAGAL